MSGARTRTMAHLAKLALAASGCSHELAVVTLSTPPPPATSAAPATTTIATVAKSPPPPLDDDMVVREPMHGHDPVGPPPPQHCVSVAAATQATATMQRGPGGVFDVDVRITLSSAAHATFAVPKANQVQSVQAYGAVPVSATIGATNAVLRLRLNMLADKATVQLYVPLACAPGSGALTVFLSYDRQAASAKVDRVDSR